MVKSDEITARRMVAQTAVYYYRRQARHRTPQGHPDSRQRIPRILRAIRKSSLFDGKVIGFEQPSPAQVHNIREVHDDDYINSIREFCAAGGGAFDEDTYLSPGSFEAASYSAGGAMDICDRVLERGYANGFVLTRPPGHHAGRRGRALNATSTGFCVFNNVAIASHFMINHRDVAKLMIIDLDAHHGNGTQEIFYKSPSALFVGFHQDGKAFFPFSGSWDEIGEEEGRGFTANVPLPAGAKDADYMYAFREVVTPLAAEYSPEFVLVSIGFDAHRLDPLSDLRLSTAGYLRLISAIKHLADSRCDGRLVACLEGGYNLDVLSRVASSMVFVLAGLRQPPPSSGPDKEVHRKTIEHVEALRGVLQDFWTL